jgi:hypothetical protein
MEDHVEVSRIVDTFQKDNTHIDFWSHEELYQVEEYAHTPFLTMEDIVYCMLRPCGNGK